MADTGEKDAETQPNGLEGVSKEAASVMALLAECGVQEYDPRVVSMLMEVQYSVTSKILQMASGLSRHAEKPRIDADDVQTAADVIGLLATKAPNREKMLQLANDKNQQPLPQIRHNYGLKLPNDRFCQMQQNVLLKTDDYQHVDVPPIHRPNIRTVTEGPTAVLRPEHVQNMLKRPRNPDDDFDA